MTGLRCKSLWLWKGLIFCMHIQGLPENCIHFVSLLLCSNYESITADTPFIWKFMNSASKWVLKLSWETRITKVIVTRIWKFQRTKIFTHNLFHTNLDILKYSLNPPTLLIRNNVIVYYYFIYWFSTI